jgi:hypothetical protein
LVGRAGPADKGECPSYLISRQIETAIAFRSQKKAAAFEKYLKRHSGRAFASKNL